MKNLEIRVSLLLSIQRALLGMIYPSIRGIAVGHNKTDKLKVIYYLDREPKEYDYENISDVIGEICSDIEFTEVEGICIFSLKPFSQLDNLDAWVYVRQENNHFHK